MISKNKTIKIDDEEVHLKKGFFGYRVIHPPMINGKRNWINLLVGGWGNFITLIFILLILLSFFVGVKEMIASCNDFAENPCDYIDLDCSADRPISEYKIGGLNVEKG